MFQVTKNKIRVINWGKTYLWEIQFPDAPVPFNEWFPATDIEEPQWNLETTTVSVGLTSIELPAGTSSKDLKVTFLDDQYTTIYSWVRKWVEGEILNNGQHVGYLSNIGKPVHVRKYLETGELLKISSYIVYPKGSQFWNGNSESQALSGMLEFVVISGFWDSDLTGSLGDTTSSFDPLGNVSNTA